MVKEERAERLMMGHLHHLAEPPVVAHCCCFAAARAMQREPSPAAFQPFAQRPMLPLVREGSSDVSDQQSACRQPALEVGKIVTDGGAHRCRLLQEIQQTKASIIHVMSRGCSWRITTYYQMNLVYITHWSIFETHDEE